MPSRKGYWILFTTFACPLCSCGRTYQERVYDRPKPERWEERYLLYDDYDGCLG